MPTIEAPGIPVRLAAKYADMSYSGFRKLAERTGMIVVVDGHRYVDVERLRAIIDGRKALSRKSKSQPEAV